MTCIVAIKHKDKDGNVSITMGADSAASSYRVLSETSNCTNKIIKKANMLIGAAGCVRVANCIEHEFNPPLNCFSQKPKPEEFEAYMVARFVPALIEFLDSKKLLEKDQLRAKEDSHFSLLIACNERIYQAHSNFAVVEADTYTAIGSGSRYALGYLFSKRDEEFTDVKEVEKTIETALHAAAFHDFYVDSNVKFKTITFDNQTAGAKV